MLCFSHRVAFFVVLHFLNHSHGCSNGLSTDRCSMVYLSQSSPQIPWLFLSSFYSQPVHPTVKAVLNFQVIKGETSS